MTTSIATHTATRVQALDRLAELLDASIQVPGTTFRIGLDPLLGLIPGIGDLLTGIVSMWIVIQAWRVGATFGTVLRMMFNVVVDVVIGIIPLFGDLADFVLRTNRKNVALLVRDLRAQGRL